MLSEPEHTEFHKKVHHSVRYEAVVKLLPDCHVILFAASLSLKVFHSSFQGAYNTNSNVMWVMK
jgi:hypothetical protein